MTAGLVLAATVTLSCGSTEVCACEVGGATVIVYGTVSSPEGAGVAGALVRVDARDGEGCPGVGASGMSQSQPGAEFGGAGLYRAEAIAFEEVADVCLTVRAIAPLDSASLGDSEPVEITADFAFTETPDSVEVPLTLTR